MNSAMLVTVNWFVNLKLSQMWHTSYSYWLIPRLNSTLSGKSLGINLISVSINWFMALVCIMVIRSMQYRETQRAIGLEFIISQQIIELLLESPLNIWDSTLAQSLSRARCASLASISRVDTFRKRKTNSSVGGNAVRSSVRSFFRSALSPRGNCPSRFFSRALLSHSHGSLPFFHSLHVTIPVIRGRAVCPI